MLKVSGNNNGERGDTFMLDNFRAEVDNNAHQQFPEFPKQIGMYAVKDALGQGSYGNVYSALNTGTMELVAVKRIVRADQKSQETLFHQQQKEIMIHKNLKHDNIIRLREVQEVGDSYFLMLELAAGGELFDRIEPDVGLPPILVHFYFRQLIQAVEYIHGLGVAHRDLKPENILLDNRGNLKVTDFGLSTVYFFRGKRRLLTTVCGTPVYMAPELATESHEYNGDSCDIWSCGVILYVLLVGNTPWEEPTFYSPEFSQFVNNYKQGDQSLLTCSRPWKDFEPSLRDLILGLLCPLPENRWGIKEIKANSWFCLDNPLLDENGQCKNPDLLAEELAHYRNRSSNNGHAEPMEIVKSSQASLSSGILEFSQSPDPMNDNPTSSQTMLYLGGGASQPASFSQPEQFLCSSTFKTCATNSSSNGVSTKQRMAASSQYRDNINNNNNNNSNNRHHQHQFQNFSFSQPADAAAASVGDEPFKLTSSSGSGGGISSFLRNPFGNCANYLTRFYSRFTMTEIMEHLEKSLESFLVPYKKFKNNGMLTFSTFDKRKCPLMGEIKILCCTNNPNRGEINAIDTERSGKNETTTNSDPPLSIVVFSRTKGDAIEFKRFYRIVLLENQHLVYRGEQMSSN